MASSKIRNTYGANPWKKVGTITATTQSTVNAIKGVAKVGLLETNAKIFVVVENPRIGDSVVSGSFNSYRPNVQYWAEMNVNANFSTGKLNYFGGGQNGAFTSSNSAADVYVVEA